jgi:HSP20 family protein
MPKDLIRLMQALFLPGATCSSAPWAPAADVYRTRRGWLVKFDLAGVRPEDIALTAAGNALTVRGVRRDWVPDEGCRHYRMEIAYNRFERTLELPCDVGRADVSTDYRDGMLLVNIEQREARP